LPDASYTNSDPIFRVDDDNGSTDDIFKSREMYAKLYADNSDSKIDDLEISTHPKTERSEIINTIRKKMDYGTDKITYKINDLRLGPIVTELNSEQIGNVFISSTPRAVNIDYEKSQMPDYIEDVTTSEPYVEIKSLVNSSVHTDFNTRTDKDDIPTNLITDYQQPLLNILEDANVDTTEQGDINFEDLKNSESESDLKNNVLRSKTDTNNELRPMFLKIDSNNGLARYSLVSNKSNVYEATPRKVVFASPIVANENDGIALSGTELKGLPPSDQDTNAFGKSTFVGVPMNKLLSFMSKLNSYFE
jgi:hypothetical protein